MQNPKFSLLICALALGTVLTVRAQDNPQQAAARAAVASKLFELSSDSGTNSPAVTPPTAQTPVDQATLPKPADEPTMVPITGPTDDQKKQAADLVAAQKKAEKEAAKQAAAQQKADLAAAKAKAKADKKAAALKAKQDAAMGVQVQQTSQPAPIAPATTGLNEQQAAAMAALNNANGQPANTTTAPTAATAAPVMSMPMSTAPSYSAPSLPISADKQQRLNDLLNKYRADQITPGDYHAQRAAILAEP